MNGMKQSVLSGQYFPILSFDAEKMYTYLDDDKYPEGEKGAGDDEIKHDQEHKRTKEFSCCSHCY